MKIRRFFPERREDSEWWFLSVDIATSINIEVAQMIVLYMTSVNDFNIFTVWFTIDSDTFEFLSGSLSLQHLVLLMVAVPLFAALCFSQPVHDFFVTKE